MAVDDIDIAVSFFLPNKADPPLIIDADRILACLATPQRLEPVSPRGAKVLPDMRVVEDPQLSQRR